jgi:hypothetical protein
VNELDAAQFEALGPWITGFEFGGVQYSGQYRAGTDPRVLGFVSTFRERLATSNRRRDQPLRILECGCLEGGHTTVLAQAFPEAEITSIDVREASLQKAKFILSASGVTNVRLSKENLNEPSAALSQQYDAIFCIGLLYHLRQPAEFRARAAKAADFLWLSTIICDESEATRIERDFRGRSRRSCRSAAGWGESAIFSPHHQVFGQDVVESRIQQNLAPRKIDDA